MAERATSWISGEWLLSSRPNGGTIITLRATWTATIVFLSVVALDSRLNPQSTWSFDIEVLRTQFQSHIAVFGAVFAGVYAALYARFSSQWTYLANVYNQLMATEARIEEECRRLSSDSAARNSQLDAWWASFIEDAIDMHLATKPMFAPAVAHAFQKQTIAAAFAYGTVDGVRRLESLKVNLIEVLGSEFYSSLAPKLGETQQATLGEAAASNSSRPSC